MNITEYSLTKRVVTYTVLVMIIISGMMSMRTISQAEDPGFVIRVATVITYFPGASAKRVEELVTNQIEEKIQEIPEIDFIKSESKTGASIINVNIKEEFTDLRPIWDNMRRKIDDVIGDLPKGVIGPVINDEYGDVFGTLVSITGDGYSYKELEDYSDFIKEKILQIGDVSKVEQYGIQDENIYLEYENSKLASLGITPSYISQAIASQNIILSGGTIYTNDEAITLEPSGNLESIKQLNKLLISLPDNKGIIQLRDIVKIRTGYASPPNKLVHYKGTSSLSLGISMKTGGNIVTMGEEIEKTIKEITRQLPLGIELNVPLYQSQVVEEKVDDFMSNLYQAVIIVFISMLFFLGFRTGLIVASLIPIAVLASIIGMDSLGLSLDQMTLAALIIALGMLVDNGIVMVESITVQVKEGKTIFNACLDSATELKIPLLTSSLTTSAAFMPFYLAESTMGEYIGVLFVVITLTLIASWVVSITIIPAISSDFLFSKKVLDSLKNAKPEQFNQKFYVIYRSILKFAINRKYLFVTLTIVLFLISLQAMNLVPKTFFPENERPLITAEFKFPEGTSIYKTEAFVKEMESYINKDLVKNKEREEGILDWTVFTGGGEPRFVLTYSPSQASPNSTIFIINISQEGYILSYMLRDKLRDFVRENYPDIQYKIRGLAQGSTTDNPFEIRISGDKTDEIFKIVNKVKSELATNTKAVSISDDWGPKTKKLLIDIDTNRALRTGVTNEMIANSLKYYLKGDQASEFRRNDDIIPIVLRSSEGEKLNLNELESVQIFNPQSGLTIPLKQVADIKVEWESAKIYRRDLKKTVTISAQVDNGESVNPIFKKIEAFVEKEKTNWPTGYDYEFGGEREGKTDAINSVIDKFPVSIMIIILLLIIQFNSIKKPLIILMTIPLGMIGVTLGLLITGETFGFMAFLGVVSLSGIIINNAIVLIDRIQIEINDFGRTEYDAIIEAGQRRLLPIIMTTLSTSGGLVPLWLFGGSMWSSMAVTILFGLLVATLLTLCFVPSLYSIMFKVKK